MAGKKRLGIGYARLVIGLAYVFMVWAASSVSVSGGRCDASPTRTGCDDGNGVSVGMATLLFPGVALLIAALPLIVFGHMAKRDERATQAREQTP